MAKTNFQYEKRQRELEKKKKAEQKAEEKARRKQEEKSRPDGEQGDDTPEAARAEAPERQP